MKPFAPHQLDFYKTGHHQQYPNGTEYVYSNLTARSGKHSNVENSKGIIFIGLQLFIKDVLIDEWNDTFFNVPKEKVINKYKNRVSVALGYEIKTEHLEALHDLGYLPVKIKALPEGSYVPYRVPMLTIVNTLPEFYWVTNMLESVMSAELWQMINSATTYFAYLKRFHYYAEITGSDKSFIPFQGHDFSFRGMPGREAAAKSAFAALACGSKGTDTVSGIDVAVEYYNAKDDEFIAGSVNATEHSVMCAGSKDGEFDTFKRLLTETYPTGALSIVSDTWDFWKVIEYTLPKLKSIIMARDGKLIIRPDSGDPVDIICGAFDDYGHGASPEQRGLIDCLWHTFGGTTNDKGYKVLSEKIGAIYGDSITLDRQEEILRRLKNKGFASSNIVLGIGSYTYQMTTRDTHGMAVKATSVTINGVRQNIYKDPKTDSGLKKSAKGFLMVSNVNGNYELRDCVTEKEERRGCLEVVFEDGKIIKETNFNDIASLVSSIANN